MIEDVVFYVIGSLFGLKILWNLLIPYVFVFGKRTTGISLMPVLELLLLGIALLLPLITGLVWPWRPVRVALIGSGAIIASYAHLYVGTVIATWLFKRRRSDK